MSSPTLRPAPLRLIGVAGGIGSGKSEFVRRLAHRGLLTIDVDTIVHQLYQPSSANATGRQCFDALVALLGAAALNADGTINRPALAKRFFADPALKAAVEQTVWPYVQAEVVQVLDAAQRDGHRLAVLEATLLFLPANAPLLQRCHATVAVTATDATRVARVQKRNCLPEADARVRLASQTAAVQLALDHAQCIVSNDWPVAERDYFTLRDPLQLQADAVLVAVRKAATALRLVTT